MIHNLFCEHIIPESLHEALTFLSEMLDSAELEGMSRDEFMTVTHHGLGRQLRNSWGLWRQEYPLTRMFTTLGLTNADDMSGCILAAYWAAYKGEPFDVVQHIQNVQDYYENSNVRYKASH